MRNIQNTYRGSFHSDARCYQVTINGVAFDPAPSLKIRDHSPDGFAFGYTGSGPAQLALAILFEETTSAEFAENHYQDFKQQVIAGLPHTNGASWILTSEEIQKWMEKQ